MNTPDVHRRRSILIFERCDCAIVISSSYNKTFLQSFSIRLIFHDKQIALPAKRIRRSEAVFFRNSEHAYIVNRFLTSQTLNIYINQTIFRYIEQNCNLYFKVENYSLVPAQYSDLYPYMNFI